MSLLIFYISYVEKANRKNIAAISLSIMEYLVSVSVSAFDATAIGYPCLLNKTNSVNRFIGISNRPKICPTVSLLSFINYFLSCEYVICSNVYKLLHTIR